MSDLLTSLRTALRPSSGSELDGAEHGAGSSSQAAGASRAPKSGSAPTHHGFIDAIRSNAVVGWAWIPKHGPPDEVRLRVDNVELGSTGDFTDRPDVCQAGLAEGPCGWSVPLGALPRDNRRHQFIATLYVGGAEVGQLKAKLLVSDTDPLNTNPCLRPGPQATVLDWELDCPARADVGIERIPTGYAGLPFSAYTRLSTHDPSSSGTWFGLVQTAPVRASSSADLCLRIMARSPTCTRLVARLGTGEKLRTESWAASGAWFIVQVPFGDHVPAAISVGFVHHGVSILDLAYVAIVPVGAPALSFRDADAKAGPSSLIVAVNSRLDKWTRGLKFSAAPSGTELADGWFFDCTRGQEDSMTAALHQTPDKTSLLGSQIAYGMVVSHRLTEGESRLSTPLQRGALLSARGVRFTLHAGAMDGTSDKLDEILLVGRTATNSTVLWVRNLGAELHRSVSSVEVTIEPSEMDRIRAVAADWPRLELALQWHRPYRVVVYGVDVALDATAHEPPAPDLAYGIEDPVARGQLAVTRMLEGWGTPRPARSEARPMHTDVEVVIPVHNALEDVANCLESLLLGSDGSYRVIVVDDASTPRTARYLDRFATQHPEFRVLRNETNQGYTKSSNLGILATSSPVVVLLNSDTVVGPGWCRRMLEAKASRPRVGVVSPISNAASWQSVPRPVAVRGGWCVNPIPGGLSAAGFDGWLRSQWTPRYPEVPIVNGFCQMLDREMLGEVGLYDEETFPIGYGEETDLHLRARAAGWISVLADNVYVYHAKSRSFGRRRAGLSQQATERLVQKHSAVDWGAIEASMRDEPSLLELRQFVEAAWYGTLGSDKQ